MRCSDSRKKTRHSASIPTKIPGQTIIAGMGELHLEIIRDRMFREFKVDANAGKPQIAYRETITTNAHGEGKFIKQSGGRGQYGHVEVDVRPNERGKGRPRREQNRRRHHSAEYIPAVMKGIQEAVLNGVLGGYPVVDVEVDIVYGSFHEVDSNELAFKMAAIFAMKDGFKQGETDSVGADHESRKHHPGRVSRAISAAT